MNFFVIMHKWADRNVSGILQAFYPGSLAGQAVADILFGTVSPSAKLPITFYRDTTDLPDFRDYSMDNRTYRYFTGEPLYPFGFGLTYSKFSLEVLAVDNRACKVRIRNEGDRLAREVMQVYVTSPGQKESRNLCGFAAVELEAGTVLDTTVNLWKNAFCRYSEQGDLEPIPGRHSLYLGFSQPDDRSCCLYGQKPVCVMLDI